MLSRVPANPLSARIVAGDFLTSASTFPSTIGFSARLQHTHVDLSIIFLAPGIVCSSLTTHHALRQIKQNVPERPKCRVETGRYRALPSSSSHFSIVQDAILWQSSPPRVLRKEQSLRPEPHGAIIRPVTIHTALVSRGVQGFARVALVPDTGSTRLPALCVLLPSCASYFLQFPAARSIRPLALHSGRLRGKRQNYWSISARV